MVWESVYLGCHLLSLWMPHPVVSPSPPVLLAPVYLEAADLDGLLVSRWLGQPVMVRFRCRLA